MYAHSTKCECSTLVMEKYKHEGEKNSMLHVPLAIYSIMLFFVFSLDEWPDLKCLSPLLSQCSQLVPQVTDALATEIHSSHIMIIQLTGTRKTIRSVARLHKGSHKVCFLTAMPRTELI